MRLTASHVLLAVLVVAPGAPFGCASGRSQAPTPPADDSAPAEEPDGVSLEDVERAYLDYQGPALGLVDGRTPEQKAKARKRLLMRLHDHLSNKTLIRIVLKELGFPPAVAHEFTEKPAKRRKPKNDRKSVAVALCIIRSDDMEAEFIDQLGMTERAGTPPKDETSYHYCRSKDASAVCVCPTREDAKMGLCTFDAAECRCAEGSAPKPKRGKPPCFGEIPDGRDEEFGDD